MRSLLDSLGLEKMPWVVRAYFALLIFMLLVLFVGGGGGGSVLSLNLSVESSAEVVSFALDGMKLIIGAVLGSLPLAAEKKFRDPGGSDNAAR